MIAESVKLVIYGSDSSRLDELKRSFATLPYIDCEAGSGPQVVGRAKLDALWATPMVGVQLFGAAPPFPLHGAVVLKTPQDRLARGLPRYGIVGGATSHTDPKTPEFNLRLVLTALLRAVDGFNSQESDKIERVGILPEDLDLMRIDPAEAAIIIRQVYEERRED